MNDSTISTITPPEVPVVTQPKHTGPCCAHHTNEPSVGKCARCGQHVCQDCRDVYGVTAGKYAGKCLCYDCCQAIVADNVKILKKQVVKFSFNLILTIIGMIVGAYLFSGLGGFWLVFGILWMGSFWLWLSTAVSTWFKSLIRGEMHGLLGVIVGFIGSCLGVALVAPIYTVVKLFRYTKYVISTSIALKSDSKALIDMRDYMAYTMVRSKNKDVALENLMNEGGELYNNSYARLVLENGEEAAEQTLSESATRIAENGEMVRNFAA